MKALRRLIPRFSLRTLAIFLLLVTSGVGLWYHWEPWVCTHSFQIIDDCVGDSETSLLRLLYYDTAADGPGDAWIDKGRVPFERDGVSVRPEIPGVVAVTGPLRRGDEVTLPDGTQGIRAGTERRMALSLGRDRRARLWHLRRPEWWWGVFWLWEFWLTAAFAGLFVWSVVRDRRGLRRAELSSAPPGSP